MRVLHIDTGAEMRGGQHQVLLLLLELRKSGLDCILAAKDGSPLARKASSEGFAVRPAGLFEIWRLSKSVDIVHAHDARAHTMAALASLCRFVVSRRVAFPVKRSYPSAWKYARATRFLAVSNFVAGELQAVGISQEKIDIIYDAVSTGEAGISNWNPSGPAIGLASQDPQKGRDLLARAAAIAGVDVRFSEALDTDLKAASMFVYITRSEGLGSAALLAMKMGIPVIASKVGGLKEVLVDRESGLLVENDPEAIAKAMRTLQQSPALAQRLIEQGRARLADCFTTAHLVRGTLASYARALGH